MVNFPSNQYNTHPQLTHESQVWNVFSKLILWLTLKHQEMHGCVVSTVATDALVLKHQAISILSTD